MKINENYLKLNENYLFSEIARRVSKYSEENPSLKNNIIKMGIGDVTKPLCPAVVEAIKNAADEMGTESGFHGYGPEQGYLFLKKSIADYYKKKNITLDENEIFISDGAKSDLGNILDTFATDNIVLIPDPVYPAYADTNMMDGRKIIYADATEENGFLPMPDYSVDADIIYICSPNNPTGAVYSEEQLKKWVDYALDKNAVILFDAAYEGFISDDSLSGSIYSVDGAKKCAVEVCSLSKTAGFTGTRCGYTIVPEELEIDGTKLNRLWLRRQTTKFNGVSYIVQKGAEAVFTKEGQEQIKSNIAYYQKNAEIITKTLDELGIFYTGGKNSPYIWLKCPKNIESWDFFDLLLTKANVVGTPGAGFGKNGNLFFRLTSFSTNENTKEAMDRFKKLVLSL